MALIDFTLSNARRFYSSMGNPLGVKGLTATSSKTMSPFKARAKNEETGPKANAELANVVDDVVKEGLPEEKLQEKLNEYHRPETCESLTKVCVNQSIWII